MKTRRNNLRTLALLLSVCTATVFLYTACRKRKTDCPATVQYQQLSESAKSWFPYTNNRIIVFENAAQRDTMELKNYFSGDGEVWVGDECPMTKGQFLRGNLVNKSSGDTIAVEIGYGDRVLLQKGEPYLLYYEAKGVLILPSNYRRVEPSVTLHNKTFTTVLVFECSPTDKCTAAGINKFYFSRGRGLVAYEKNGVTWTVR